MDWRLAPALAAAALMVAVGIGAAIRPRSLIWAGVVAASPLGTSEIRAVFGGMFVALGAACLVTRDAGAEVRCIHFFTGFCVTGHNSRVGRTDRPIANHALQVAAE